MTRWALDSTNVDDGGTETVDPTYNDVDETCNCNNGLNCEFTVCKITIATPGYLECAFKARKQPLTAGFQCAGTGDGGSIRHWSHLTASLGPAWSGEVDFILIFLT